MKITKFDAHPNVFGIGLRVAPIDVGFDARTQGRGRRARRLETILRAWSKALARAAEEHGRPNSFWVRELATEYGLTARDGYRIGSTRRHDLWLWLGGLQGWGSCPTYSKGRFFV